LTLGVAKGSVGLIHAPNRRSPTLKLPPLVIGIRRASRVITFSVLVLRADRVIAFSGHTFSGRVLRAGRIITRQRASPLGHLTFSHLVIG
tara:strand:+ start:275 stop:544 length:270 start_codon:yes stop_codon:yes gene_type:complete